MIVSSDRWYGAPGGRLGHAGAGRGPLPLLDALARVQLHHPSHHRRARVAAASHRHGRRGAARRQYLQERRATVLDAPAPAACWFDGGRRRCSVLGTTRGPHGSRLPLLGSGWSRHWQVTQADRSALGDAAISVRHCDPGRSRPSCGHAGAPRILPNIIEDRRSHGGPQSDSTRKLSGSGVPLDTGSMTATTVV